MISHSSLELCGPSWLEVFGILDDIIWDIGKIQKNHDQVRLLEFILVLFSLVLAFLKVLEAIFDEFLSFLGEGTNIEELLSIKLV